LEVAKGLRDRAQLHAEIITLRKELKTNMHTTCESVSKLRKDVEKIRERQAAISSVIRPYAKVRDLLAAPVKHSKPIK
jgi:DNA repair ATPase RecN